MLAARYGKIANLADFVRKAQLMNYEAYRAMYEGRNAQMFHPTTAVITWMSNPAQPSFVWQIYHYDLEPNSSLFAVKHAGEMVHIQFNEATGELQVINNLPEALTGARCACLHLQPRRQAGGAERSAGHGAALVRHHSGRGRASRRACRDHFLKLELRNAAGQADLVELLLARAAGHPDDFTDLDTAARGQAGGAGCKHAMRMASAWSRSRCAIRPRASP